MAALVKAVRERDFSQVTIPALFWYAGEDSVVRADLTADFSARWGGPVTTHLVTPGAGIDPNAHVVTGDILSPGATDATVAGILDWLDPILAQ